MGLLVEAADGYPTQPYVDGYKSRNAREGTAALPYTEISESDTDIVIEIRLKRFHVVTKRGDKI